MIFRKQTAKNPLYYEESPEATEFRRLFHKLQSQRLRFHNKIFMITSSNVSEGKSTIAASMAITSALYRNSRTLLIDCDLRRPKVHKIFDMPQEDGLADFLENRKHLLNIVKPSAIPSLKIITAGSVNSSPSRLISSLQLHKMLDIFRANFDLILADAPPVIPVSDAMILGNYVDGILFVIQAGTTKLKVAQHALDLLGENRDKVVGAVVNNLKGALPYYYNYKYYKYGYGTR